MGNEVSTIIIEYSHVLSAINVILTNYYCNQNCININGHFDNQLTCKFVQENCDQDTVQFIQVYYCIFKNSFIVLLTLGVSIALLLFEALSYISNFYLAPCVDNLMKSFNFSQTLAGVTFLAFANGAPDVLTAIIAGNSSSQETAMIPFGSLFGATIFSCAIILARVIKHSPNSSETGLKVHRGQTIKPILFYIFAALYLVLVSAVYQKMTWYLASVYIILYVIYGIMVIVDEHKKRKAKRQQLMLKGQQEQDEQGNKPKILDQVNININLTNKSEFQVKESLLRKYSQPMEPMKLRPLIEEQLDQQQQQKQDQVARIVRWYRVFLKYLFQLTVPAYDMKKYSYPKLVVQMTLSTAFIMFSQSWLLLTVGDGFPVWVIAQGAVLLILALVYIFNKLKTPKISWPLQLYSFIVCIIWISTLVAVLINIFELVQVVTGINPVFIGMTFLACGNSVGDYFSIVAFAKKGKGMTAIAGVYSGQLFNLLIGLGVSYVIKGIRKGTFQFDLFPRDTVLTDVFDNAIVWTVIFSCLGLLASSLIYLKKNNWTYFMKYAQFLLIFYLGFMLLSSLFAILSDAFGEISCNYPTLASLFS